MNRTAQMPGFVMIFIVIAFFALSIFTFSLLSPVLKTFIDVGSDSSSDHGDSVTSFIIKAMPFFIIVLLFGFLVWAIATGGGSGLL